MITRTTTKRGACPRKGEAIGLQPSSTGMVGGKETGQRMSDYIIPNGEFTKAFAKLAKAGWKLNLQSAHRPGKKGGGGGKDKFTCGECGANVWGKPDTHPFHEKYKSPGWHRRGATMDDDLDGRKKIEGDPRPVRGRAPHGRAAQVDAPTHAV